MRTTLSVWDAVHVDTHTNVVIQAAVGLVIIQEERRGYKRRKGAMRSLAPGDKISQVAVGLCIRGEKRSKRRGHKRRGRKRRGYERSGHKRRAEKRRSYKRGGYERRGHKRRSYVNMLREKRL